MRCFLLMIAVVVVVGCASTPTNWVSDPSDPNNVLIEEQIRFYAKKPTGELTTVDLDKVTSLNLGVHPLTSVKGLEKLTQLTSLDLSSNQLTSVKGLEKLTQLTRLYFNANQLTNVKVLENLTQLKDLDLHKNQLTSVKGLKKFTQLKYLWLTGNPDLTKAQIDQLKKALPKCKIQSTPTKYPPPPSSPSNSRNALAILMHVSEDGISP